MTVFSIDHIRKELVELGVRAEKVLLVHTSFRSMRPVENGPTELIQAMRDALGLEGTLVMPTMTDGEDLFDPKSTPTHDMGVTAETFWRQKGTLRSTHPGGSFAAAGPLAKRICAPQPLRPPHGLDSPPGRVYELKGQVLLLGVEQSESTLLHVAESLANVPYSIEHPCVVEIDGRAARVMIAETDHCCRGFRQVDGWLAARGLIREAKVGNARAKLADARDVVNVAVENLRRMPLVFLCSSDAACSECDGARASTSRRT